MSRTRPDPVQLLPLAAAAQRLGCSEMHVYRLIEVGELPAVDISQPGSQRSKTRVRSDHIDAYIEARTRVATRRTVGPDAA
jgi:excisionase family DNA binding protein